ncbi:MAG: NTPase [Thaumarchaeota archaeon]|jgi:nucleoside-triphosphatase|nr:NTPase [Nitrososphaerota archaeon]
MRILVTGRPGIGKTTVVSKLAKMLKDRSVKVGGMITYEIREKEVRTGFLVEDLKTGLKGLMASVNYSSGPRVGRYFVSLAEIERVGVKAIRDAVENAEVVIIDEIGPMELYSEPFRKAVSEAFSSGKSIVATIHEKASQHSFCRTILSASGVSTFVVTFGNRDLLPKIILDKLLPSS